MILSNKLVFILETSLFLYCDVKVAKQNQNPCCHLVTEIGSWFIQIRLILQK